MEDSKSEEEYKEYDIILDNSNQFNLYLFQYPLRPIGSSYSASLSLQAIQAKQDQGEFHTTYLLDQHSTNYDKASTFQMPQLNLKAAGVKSEAHYFSVNAVDNKIKLLPIKEIVQFRSDNSLYDAQNMKKATAKKAKKDESLSKVKIVKDESHLINNLGESWKQVNQNEDLKYCISEPVTSEIEATPIADYTKKLIE